VEYFYYTKNRPIGQLLGFLLIEAFLPLVFALAYLDILLQVDVGKYKELFNLQAEGYQDKPKRKLRAKKPQLEEIQEVAQ
jgi:hypothetical protein